MKSGILFEHHTQVLYVWTNCWDLDDNQHGPYQSRRPFVKIIRLLLPMVNIRYLPVIRHQNRLSRVDEAGLCVIRWIEDFDSIIPRRSHDNETWNWESMGRHELKMLIFRFTPLCWHEEYVHIEYTDSTQSARVPLTLVTLHSRIQRISKLSNDWNCPFGSWEMRFFVTIYRLLKS